MYLILFKAHSGFRWLLVLLAVVTIAKLMAVWLQKGRVEKFDSILISSLTGLIDLQILLGLILLFWDASVSGSFAIFRIEHAVTMIIAAALAHLPVKWKKVDGPERAKKTAFALLGAFALIAVGVTRLPQGW